MKKYMLYFILHGIACGYGFHLYIEKAKTDIRAEMILEKPLKELVEYKI